MKPHFDVDLSLRLCPPNYTKGVRFKKRIVLNRGQDGVVTYNPIDNPRVMSVVQNKIPPLVDSFKVFGYRIDCSPPTIKVDPKNKNRFVGLTGFHRDAAAARLDWETMVYDIVEFDSPLDERIHVVSSNNNVLPAIPNTILDIVKQVKEALVNKEIENDDDAIRSLIESLASDKTKDAKSKIFKKLRDHISYSSTLRSYHTDGGENSTQEFAEKYNLPFEGDRRYLQSGKLGYITGIKTPKTTLFDAKNLSNTYGNIPVYIYAWIKDNPKEAPAIYKQRKYWLERFNQFVREDCEAMKNIMSAMNITVDVDKLVDNHPVKFGGFLAQDLTPDIFNGGNPKEDGLVDVNGNAI
jgi:hypothetical protein